MMLSSEVWRWLAFWDRPGRDAISSVSDREKPIAVPKDCGMFMEELSCARSFDKLGLEQSVQERTKSDQDGNKSNGSLHLLNIHRKLH